MEKGGRGGGEIQSNMKHICCVDFGCMTSPLNRQCVVVALLSTVEQTLLSSQLQQSEYKDVSLRWRGVAIRLETCKERMRREVM